MLIKFLKPDFEYNDDRGSITQLVHDNWKQFNYITSKAGIERGNHYHKNNKEAFYVISGAFEIELKNIITNEVEKYNIEAGTFFSIDSNINHTFRYIKDTYLISMYSEGVEKDGEKDIYKI